MKHLPYPDRRLIEQVLSGEAKTSDLPKHLRAEYDKIRKAAKQSKDGHKEAGVQTKGSVVSDDMGGEELPDR